MTPLDWKSLLDNMTLGVAFVSLPAIIFLWKHLRSVIEDHKKEITAERQYSRDRDNSTLVVLNSVLEYVRGEDKREGLRNIQFKEIMQSIDNLRKDVLHHLEEREKNHGTS